MRMNHCIPSFALATLIACVVSSVGLPSVATADLFDIKFRLTKDVTVDDIQFDVDYTAANGNFVGAGDGVDCTVNSAINSIGAFNDIDASLELRQALMNISGIDGPVKIVTCSFDASIAPAKADFVVEVTSWSPAVTPDPKVKVAGVVAQ